ncbi:DUF4328 domain-containing protein [Micromonospora rubida]|uniref:DUF4328 domain-containing protein n=1 Tax=Micromonospora rubida TaxID=2697657 RepID=UPI002E2B7776|nr:DUF4328 domain-containing protein [Micromonospora rubida]
MAPGVPTYPVGGLGRAVVAAVAATAVLYTLVAFYPAVGAVLARRAAEAQDTDVLLGAVLLEVLFILPFGVAHLTAAVLMIIWTWRARKNLDAFPGALPQLNPGWVIAGWLVPLANFVVPVRVMAGIARDSLWRARTPVLVGVWWAAWLAFSLSERLVSWTDNQEYERLPEDPFNDIGFQAYVGYYQDALVRNLVPLAACLIAAASLIVLVRRITAAQQARIALAVPAWPAPPGWPGAPVPYGWPGAPAPHPAAPHPTAAQPAATPTAAETPPAVVAPPAGVSPSGVPAGSPVAGASPSVTVGPPVAASPELPVTDPSPQVAGALSAVSPPAAGAAGGTIGA